MDVITNLCHKFNVSLGNLYLQIRKSPEKLTGEFSLLRNYTPVNIRYRFKFGIKRSIISMPIWYSQITASLLECQIINCMFHMYVYMCDNSTDIIILNPLISTKYQIVSALKIERKIVIKGNPIIISANVYRCYVGLNITYDQIHVSLIFVYMRTWVWV